VAVNKDVQAELAYQPFEVGLHLSVAVEDEEPSPFDFEQYVRRDDARVEVELVRVGVAVSPGDHDPRAERVDLFGQDPAAVAPAEKAARPVGEDIPCVENQLHIAKRPFEGLLEAARRAVGIAYKAYLHRQPPLPRLRLCRRILVPSIRRPMRLVTCFSPSRPRP
jgi:hypothetical protein